MPFETLIHKKEDEIDIVTLNRPGALNALNMKLKEELLLLFIEMEKDPMVKVVILTGGEKFFCAGADIKERSSLNLSPSEFYSLQRKTHEVFWKIENFEKPVIAAINGVAIGGGCELILVCDFRIASETARFGFPEVQIGTIPAGGATQRVSRLIGFARAKELIFTGDLIDAQEAYRLGLVNKVVSSETLMEEAKHLAQKLRKNPPLAIKFAKKAIHVGLQLDMPSALDYEIQCASILCSSEDFNEGIRSFVEKRKPIFKGR